MAVKQLADVVIVGSGIAALIAADQLSDDKNVIIITKSKKENSNSIWAQGGVAAVVARNDNWKYHFQDTLEAGCFHNNENATKMLVRKGPEIISKLIDTGMKFDRDHKGKIHLGKEGAHSKRRILHAGGDATGKALIEFMLEKVKSKVKIIEDEMAVDLIIRENQCFGVKAINKAGRLKTIFAAHTILATGGCGGLYTFTSNDPSITGDGIAMAYRAGAELVDLEFIQFHPTMLFLEGEGKGLISEAVRGEGAILLTEGGKRLMDGIHPQKDLAPRDIVAREIHHAVRNGKKVLLDISMIENFDMRFPTITELCKRNGVDLKKGKIPVVPGAHFLMGGIKTDTKGQTSIQSLYAVGEAACSGVHGANRLASNSLLEGMVFAHELSKYILSIQEDKSVSYPEMETNLNGFKEATFELPKAVDIRTILMNEVGIVRTKEGLERAKTWFENYSSPFLEKGSLHIHQLSIDEIKIVNMLTTGWLITTSALMRTESRGGHYRKDYPQQNDKHWGKKEIIRHVKDEVNIDM